jgi:hypothetical protein
MLELGAGEERRVARDVGQQQIAPSGPPILWHGATIPAGPTRPVAEEPFLRRRSSGEGRSLEVKRVLVVARQQRERLGFKDRRVVALAGEGADVIE